MSVQSPTVLKKARSCERKTCSPIKSREVLELEAILADLQDSPLKNSSSAMYSPSRVRSSPSTNPVQKSPSHSSPGFKRNLTKEYSSPSVKMDKQGSKSSPIKVSFSPSTKITNGNSNLSSHKTYISCNQPMSDEKRNMQMKLKRNLDVSSHDNVSDCVSPSKACSASEIMHSNGSNSSQKLSITKKNLKVSNSGGESETQNNQLSEKLLSSEHSGTLKVRKIISPARSLPSSNKKQLNGSYSLPVCQVVIANIDSDIAKIENPVNKQKGRDEKLETCELAEILRDSDTGDDDDDVSFSFVLDTRGGNVDREVLSEPTANSNLVTSHSGRRNRKQDLSKLGMGYDDEDIVIMKDHEQPDESTNRVSNKKNVTNSNSKSLSYSKSKNTNKSKLRKKLGFDDDDDNILILEDIEFREKKNVSSKKKERVYSSGKGSKAKTRNLEENASSGHSSRISKARRSLLKEHDATYSISDCSQSPLRLKLKRKVIIANTTDENSSEDEIDDEPLSKLRKTESSKLEKKVEASYNSDIIIDSDEEPLIRKTKSKPLKRSASMKNTEDPKDDITDRADEPLPKVRRIGKDSQTDSYSPEKSLRCRASLKLPKWRELDGITSLTSPTKSPATKLKSPQRVKNTVSPQKSLRNPTSEKNDSTSEFNRLLVAVQNKHGKPIESPNRKQQTKRLEMDDDEVEYINGYNKVKKIPVDNGLAEPSPRRSKSKIVSRPLESNESNSRSSRSKNESISNYKTERDLSTSPSRKKSNKENLISPPLKVVAKEITKSPVKSHVTPGSRATQIANSPMKINSPLPHELTRLASTRKPPIKSTNSTEFTENSLDNARLQLMVSAVPKSLPCRDKEFNNIYSFLGRKIEDFAGGCMYISGVPGTGKTATVHAVIRKLQDDVDNGDLSPFNFIEINSLRLTEPRQAYTRILQGLTGDKLPSEQALRMLDKKFSCRERKSTVLLVDELDYLCNRRQDVIYSILEWPMRQGSGVIVLTIANTMDLPERTLKGKVTSRMGLTRLTFQPYTHHQLQEIVMNRLIGNDSFHPDAVQLVARKVAAVSGDARRALDICRRATELVDPIQGASTKTVTIQHIEKAVNQISSGRRILAIRACSTMAQLALRALRDETLRTGIDESNLSHMYKHLLSVCALEGVEKPTIGEIQRVCTNLESLGLVIAEKGRPDLMRKLSLNVSSDDIHYALNC